MDRETADGIVWDDQAGLFRALGDATRLRLVRLLWREELNVQELCQILEMPQPRISRHLAVLRGLDMVRDRREGTKIYYALSPVEGALEPLGDYLSALGRSDHPDLERLETCLQQRVRHARSFADGKADEWDQIGRRLHNASATMLALANLAPRGLVLADLGTGTGRLLPFLSRYAEHVYAVDQSREMLRRARQRCTDLGLGNVFFVRSPIEETVGLVPACDGLVLNLVLHQVARPQALMLTLRSLLKPTGRLVVIDRTAHEDEQAKTAFGSVWLGFEREQLRHWSVPAGLAEVGWQVLTSDQGEGASAIELFVAVFEPS